MNGARPRSNGQTASEGWYWLCMVLIGAALASGLAEPLLAMTRSVALDSNEGWNAFFQQAAMRGAGLYPSPGGVIINNYPPLSFYVVGALGRLTGDNIFAGRAVALVSMLVVIVNSYLWLRAAESSARVASLGAGVVAVFAVTYARPYAAMNDPQWLAHALMTTGLVVMWRGNASTRAIVLGSILMLAAGWTKHLLIPLPIAATWWLMRRSRAALTTWIVCSGLLLAVSGFLAWWLYGDVFFDSLHAARVYSRQQAIRETGRALGSLAPIIALSLALLPVARRSERAQFAVVYFLAAAAVAVAASGGVGVDINAFFDLMIAASLCSALTLENLWERRLSRGIGAGQLLALILCFYLAGYAGSLLPGVLRDYRGLDDLEKATLATTRLIADTAHGRAACESPEFCYWAKGPFLVDFFNYGQRLKVGKQPLTACESVFDGKYISLVQLDPGKGNGTRQLPPSCNAVILKNYHPVATSMLGVMLAAGPPASVE
jgi:hypothetical protein